MGLINHLTCFLTPLWVSGKKPWVDSDVALMEGDGESRGHFEGTHLCGLEGPLVLPLYSRPLYPGPFTSCCIPQHSWTHASQSGYPRWITASNTIPPTPILQLLPMLMPDWHLGSGNRGICWALSQFVQVGKDSYLTSLWRFNIVIWPVGTWNIEHPYWPHIAGGLCS